MNLLRRRPFLSLKNNTLQPPVDTAPVQGSHWQGFDDHQKQPNEGIFP